MMHRIKKIYSETDHRMRGIFFASMTALLWGFLPIALKIAVEEVNPVTVSWIRFAVAFLVLFLIFVIRSPKSLSIIKNPPWLLIIASVGLALNYVAYIAGVKLTSPSNAQVIIQVAPIFLALIGLVVFKEKISTVQGAGLVLAVMGFTFFYGDQLAGFLGPQSDYNSGTLLVVFSAMSWVVYATIQKKLVQKYPPQSLNIVIYGFPALLLAPFVDYSGLAQLSFSFWLLMIFLGLNTLAAYGALAEAFKYIEVNKVGIIITLNPIITIISMHVLEYFQVSWIQPESISYYGLIGALLIISGAILAVRSKGKSEFKEMEEQQLQVIPKSKPV